MWEKIEKQLNKKNKTAYWLAKETGLPYQSIYSIKRNKNQQPSFSYMVKIADALEISLDEFR
ncbi:helix-turn-helix domain-containing protein [Fructobacillus tropaeoli]|uniref:helix-turn-helix domain-containing protein n=1 Tax=Fructobacillus tropaeoli TaxID=709323 RepID=UPI0019411287|nr:helix-turn-helix transcriptional regulator [Fructobacillus tropaeoli]GIC70584.1 transcriptional regulator [Fructobacillus tropaeoli]